MKHKLKNVLIVLFAVTFILCGIQLTWVLIQDRQSEKVNNEAHQIANMPKETVAVEPDPTQQTESLSPSDPAPTESEQPEEPSLDAYATQLSQLNMAGLQEKNPEVIGWIMVPGTHISHPILHTNNNNTYLTTAWDGTYSRAGSIFLETRNQADFNDYNTIIYGHNMRNGAMFADLHLYKDAAFRDENPYVYIAYEGGIRKYEIFSGYEAAVVSDTYRLVFSDLEQQHAALISYVHRSQWESPVIPSPEDPVLTLSTCTGSGYYDDRWVVQAVLVEEWATNHG